MRLKTLSLVLLTSCGAFEKEDKKPKEPTNLECLEKVQPVRDFYASQLPNSADPLGWQFTNKCDALLFNSLIATGGVAIDLTAARGTDGAWYRRPAQDCYETGGSKSSISRDMLLGLMFYATLEGDSNILQSIYDYGVGNDWVMGKGTLTRTFFSPGLQGTLAEAIFLTSGVDYPEREYPQVWTTENVGFAAHLDVLHILLRGYIKGGISEFMQQVLAAQYTRSPRNPLFSYAFHKYRTGDYREALSLLDNSEVWPKDRLPTSDNFCESEWYFQRDPDSWAPCPEKGETHTGGELIFLTKLIERELGQ